MDTNKKQAWVDGLRSGQYQQAREVLNAGDNRYCCLGVLCSLYMQSPEGRAKEARWVKSKSGYLFSEVRNYYGSQEIYENNDLPPSVRAWAGLKQSNPIFVLAKNKERINLSTANDAKGENFNQIADRIQFGAEQVS